VDDDTDVKMMLTAPPPEKWKRPPGSPCITWLNTIQWDLRAYNLTLNETWPRTVICGGWCLLVALRTPTSACQ